MQQDYRMYALESSIIIKLEKFGLFLFDQNTLLLRDRYPLLKNEPKILTSLHQGD